MTPPPLAALFPPEDFGFRLTLKRGELRAFFAASDDAPTVLAERRRWLAERPQDSVIEDPESAPAWAELAGAIGVSASEPRALGAQVEPDVVLLRRDEVGAFRVRSGVVVFPTSWALPEKAGLTLAETHDVVPGLNAQIGAAIDRFLDRLKPGAAAMRANWGLAATAELNLHPALGRPRLRADTPLESVWLRVEHQILAALPESGAIVFGIRIALHPWGEVVADATARTGLRRALATMPERVAAYKGLAGIRARLVAELGEA
ncbi:heme-dependent oxidative N-demethylase subunit alpha family protein [Actomonas aquatica]|uniref:DUF3445 domain-containing protein n=1 Tax=Actomonas aquatica TaxID=2866162 RepID=A0ABZ1CEV9_9BACT|nr:heme-dependent oxidative N-demethylase subunit alpha family protein [Opitutus sp. WL0086]WRQ88815.1 DUF3445 domain-containing protein [Opitutus sp. WL0086]